MDKEGETIFFDESNQVQPKNITYEFIPLETRDDNLIGGIKRVEIYKDKIYILDSHQDKGLTVYGINGNFISKVGTVGGGPGEYSLVANFYIDKKRREIKLFDQNKQQFLSYDLDTYKYLYTTKMPIEALSCAPLNSNHYAFYKPMTFEKQRKKFFLQVTDSSYADVGAYYYPADFITSYSLSSQDFFYETEEKILFHLPYDSEIYQIDSAGIKPLYYLSHSKYKFPPKEYLNEIGSPNRNYVNTLLSSDYIACSTFQENNNFIMINFIVNRKIENALYYKKEKISYNLSRFSEECKQMNVNFPFVGTYKDYFIGYIMPGKKAVLYFKDKYTLSEEDNPVLCMIKFE